MICRALNLLDLFRGTEGKVNFHTNTQMLYVFFTMLTFALMVQKKWWVKLLPLGTNQNVPWHFALWPKKKKGSISNIYFYVEVFVHIREF